MPLGGGGISHDVCELENPLIIGNELCLCKFFEGTL